MKYIVFLILISSPLTIFAQGGSVKEIPFRNVYTIPNQGELLVLDLNSEFLTYTGNEVIEFFFPADARYEFCAFANCNIQPELAESVFGDSLINISDLTGGTVKYPLGIRFSSAVKSGKYPVKISDSNGKILHIRTLTLKHPAPRISKFKVLYPGGDEIENQLVIYENKDLKDARFVFEGEYLEQDFEKVSFQGLVLKKVKGSVSTYETSDEWEVSNLDKISLEKPKFTFKRYFENQEYFYETIVKAPLPRINNSLYREIELGYDQFTLALKVSNLYKNAQIYLEELPGNDVLSSEGNLDGTAIDLVNGTLTKTILLKKNALDLGSVRFWIQVVNRDGGRSDKKIMELSVQNFSVFAQPASERDLLITGEFSNVKFTRDSTSSVFDMQQPFKLIINEIHERVLNPVSVPGNKNQIIANFKIPEEVLNEAYFELKNNNNTWRGKISNINQKPVLLPVSKKVYPGNLITLKLQNRSDKVTAYLTEANSSIHILNEDFSNGEVQIQLDDDLTTESNFTVDLRIEGRTIEDITFDVLPWMNLKDKVIFNVSGVKDSIDENTIIPINTGELIYLQSIDPGVYQNLSVELFNNNGNSVDGIRRFYKSKSDSIATIKMNPYLYGIRGGQEFFVKLRYPNGVSTTQKGYVKRKGLQKMTVNAGFSAVNVYFSERLDENGEKLPATSLISGVNLGAYYMPELSLREGKRILGVGINLIAQENEGAVDLRIGAGILLFEVMTMGLNFGAEPTAFFIGASTDLVDIAKIFGK